MCSFVFFFVFSFWRVFSSFSSLWDKGCFSKKWNNRNDVAALHKRGTAPDVFTPTQVPDECRRTKPVVAQKGVFQSYDIKHVNALYAYTQATQYIYRS